jgi:S-adenosylmethionine decarboxylase proenzyme
MEKPFIQRFELTLRGPRSYLDDEKEIKNMIERAINIFELKKFELSIHSFQPQGITGFAVVGESHVSMHTWPERNYAHMEILTCRRIPNDLNVDDIPPKECEVKEIKIQEPL